jgi:phosphoenolpyruvate carboxykinase (ATP)
LGIKSVKTIYRNLNYPQLFDHERANNEGVVAQAEYGPTFTVDTGKYTGRSPKDRWIVLNPGSETAEHIDWNNINMATTPEVYDELYDKAVAHFNTRDTAYVFDGYCGANLNTRKKIRFVHEMAWQQHFGTLTTFILVRFVPLVKVFWCLILQKSTRSVSSSNLNVT